MYRGLSRHQVSNMRNTHWYKCHYWDSPRRQYICKEDMYKCLGTKCRIWETHICTYRLYIYIVYEGCLNSECRTWEVCIYMYRLRGLSQCEMPNMRNTHLYISGYVEFEGYTFAYVVLKGCLIIECQTSKMCISMYYRRGLGIRIIRWFRCLLYRALLQKRPIILYINTYIFIHRQDTHLSYVARKLCVCVTTHF